MRWVSGLRFGLKSWCVVKERVYGHTRYRLRFHILAFLTEVARESVAKDEDEHEMQTTATYGQVSRVRVRLFLLPHVARY